MQWLSGLAGLGALEGLAFAIAILTLPSSHRHANALLAALVALVALRLATQALYYQQLASHYLYTLQHLVYLIGPLLYLYTRTLTQPERALQRRDLWHSLPVWLALAAFWPGGPLVTGDLLGYSVYEELPWSLRRRFAIAVLPVSLSLLIYALLSIGLLQRYRRQLQHSFSSMDRVALGWLRLLCLVCIGAALGGLGLELTQLTLDVPLGPRVWLPTLGWVLMIAFVGVMGLRQPLILRGVEAEQALLRVEETPDIEPQTVASAPVSTAVPKPVIAPAVAAGGMAPVDLQVMDEDTSGKYRKSGLDEETVQRLWKRLEARMREQQPYREPGLKLGDLSRFLGTRPNYLSQVINSCAGCNFYDYVNRYRVEQAMQLLRDEQWSSRTIAEIALEVGFNSQNVFNSHFKKVTGTTPSRYRNGG